MTSTDPAPSSPALPVRQLRLVIAAEDYAAALAFYRDTLGMPQQEAYSGGDGAEVTILDAGRATMEIANASQVRMIDRVEANGKPSLKLRVAFEVGDARSATAAAVDGGAQLVAEPRETPWRSLNSRLNAPEGLQLTLFEELA
ncbi:MULTISPECIES: VOC family protein [unclassified Arthrobacter]|uniref:VOC family protein n=1 Tax=unclassified Arthrobacter TaxID=235627 RepID=UPI000CE3A0A9|nr:MULTISPECIES: VOC family protein [unclassified Arthrobacter]